MSTVPSVGKQGQYVGAVMDPAAAAGTEDVVRAVGEAAARKDAEDVCFVASERFAGGRKGMVFRASGRGLGYYTDAPDLSS